MRNTLSIFLSLLLLTLTAPAAHAIVDAQLLVGKRWAEFDSQNTTSGVQATETIVSAHVDPIPLVPVSFGARFAYQDWNEGDFGGADSVEASDLGLEVMAWLPMVPFITPYGKVSYSILTPLVSTQKSTTTNNGVTTETETKTVWKGTALHFSAGILYPVPVIPLLSFMLEVGMSQGTYEIEELSIDGSKSDLDSGSDNDIDSNSTSFAFGLRVHL